MPPRQHLLGLWLLLTGAVLFAALALLLWLDTSLRPAPPERIVLWLLGLTPALLLLLLGWLLERRLFRPLRQFQVLLARLVASPDARSDFPLSGWLRSLQPDLDHIREGWRNDRERIRHARDEGAADAHRVRQELEVLLQVLDLPLLICDDHQRLLLVNPAARALFHDRGPLGLGRRVSELLPHASLGAALRQLPEDGSPRQLLLPGESHWLRCELRRLDARHGGALITLHDTTAELEADQRWHRQLAALLPRLRGHAGSLGSTAEALSQVRDNPALREQFEQALEADTRALAEGIDGLTRLLESRQLSARRLEDTWSNDLFGALQERLQQRHISLTPIGIPVWLRVDGPALLALLELLLTRLQETRGVDRIDAEALIGNRRIYLDLSWDGAPLNEAELNHWRELPLFDDPLSPRVGDVLEQHGAEFWSPPTAASGGAGLRLPLPASARAAEPASRQGASASERPEFHDFSIADLPPPDADQAALPLTQLEMIVFDTETTGLDLRGGDRIISIAACRILNGRLLAQDSFDLRVNPGCPIPAQSTAIHGLTDADVANAPPIDVALPRFHQYIGRGVLVAHNAAFDMLAVRLSAEGTPLRFDMPVLDTLLLSRALDPTLEGHGLDALAERFELVFPPGTRHTALGDARVTAELLLALLPRLKARGIVTLADALALQQSLEQESRP
jgi:DNA polymerase-3 subunit epsilon